MGAQWGQARESADAMEESGVRRCSSERAHSKLHNPGGEQVSISLSAECLCRLLDQHHLVVEEFNCRNAESRDCVRRLLLALISR